MKTLIHAFTLITLIILLFLPIPSAYGRDDSLIVFAAASTTNAVSEVAALFKKTTGVKVTLSFAASSTLAKQIQSGAPAHIYISANKKWMDFLEEKKCVRPTSRFDLLSNRIVLIAPQHSNVQIDISGGDTLEQILGKGRLALGDPSHVPAGLYAKQALENLGLWQQVKDKLAPMKDVRSALALVERKETPLGIVYATDAAISSKVIVVGQFPEDSHPPIVYPVVQVAGNNNVSADQFLQFLKTPAAKTVFKSHGFSVR